MGELKVKGVGSETRVEGEDKGGGVVWCMKFK